MNRKIKICRKKICRNENNTRLKYWDFIHSLFSCGWLNFHTYIKVLATWNISFFHSPFLARFAVALFFKNNLTPHFFIFVRSFNFHFACQTFAMHMRLVIQIFAWTNIDLVWLGFGCNSVEKSLHQNVCVPRMILVVNQSKRGKLEKEMV